MIGKKDNNSRKTKA